MSTLRIGAITAWGLGAALVIATAFEPRLADWTGLRLLHTLIVGAAITTTLAGVSGRLAAGIRHVSRTEVRRVGQIVEVGAIVQDARGAAERPPAEIVRLELDGEPVIVGATPGSDVDPATVREAIERSRRRDGAAS